MERWVAGGRRLIPSGQVRPAAVGDRRAASGRRRRRRCRVPAATGQRASVVGDRRRPGTFTGDVDAEFMAAATAESSNRPNGEREAGDRSAGEFLNASVPAVDSLTLTTRRQVRQRQMVEGETADGDQRCQEPGRRTPLSSTMICCTDPGGCI